IFRIRSSHCGLVSLQKAEVHGLPRLTEDRCPSSRWNAMCRPCCEYQLIQCRCPSKGLKVGYTVPCCRNALNQCDPCLIPPGCSLFENCKTCHNGTWRANDDFFINGKYCTDCRQGWSGGDCKTCGGVLQRAQGHIALDSYPTNARCEWTVHVERGRVIELRFLLLSLESDHSCGYDYVEVRDGDGLNSPVIGRFCGDQLPPPIKSSGSALRILFSSDGYNNFNGFVLIFQQITHLTCIPVFCLLDINSRLLPACVSDATGQACSCQTSRSRCAPPPKLHNGYHKPAPATAGGAETIEFFCNKPYILSGSQRIRCSSHGSWSNRQPKCVRACRQPRVSELVKQKVVKPQLTSRDTPKKKPSSRLSKKLKQEDASIVELPGDFLPVNTVIEYKCASPLYEHAGSSRRTCLKSGKWSGRHVSCTPVCGKFTNFSPHNLNKTQWPWHVAVYIRSPPDSPSTARPPGVDMFVQQGDSEESTFWVLACSGALLSQRSILVAAQCVVDGDKQQTLQPAQVRVVMGVHDQTSSDQRQIIRNLQVTDILVHPDFHFGAESNVAVLKLRDKAKISERVLPVCL
uniref:Peptidase domain containing associated with muscle regeneration 1a n=1 Tax=Tetraodon nigroviridis TaxID=99883 RepID=H3CW44_TETNG